MYMWRQNSSKYPTRFSIERNLQKCNISIYCDTPSLHASEPMSGLIESITILRKGWGNPISVSMSAIHDEACRLMDVANHGQEDRISLSLPKMWWLIIFHQRVLFFIKARFQRRFSCPSTLPWHCYLCNIMLFATPWRHDILGAKWGCKNDDTTFPQICKFWVRICLQLEKCLSHYRTHVACCGCLVTCQNLESRQLCPITI